jgi:hypothetical protein
MFLAHAMPSSFWVKVSAQCKAMISSMSLPQPWNHAHVEFVLSVDEHQSQKECMEQQHTYKLQQQEQIVTTTIAQLNGTD